MVKNPKILSCDLDLCRGNSIQFVRLSRHTLLQNFIKMSAVVHELSNINNIVSATTDSNNSDYPITTKATTNTGLNNKSVKNILLSV